MEFHLQYTPTRPTLGDFQLEISGVPEHVRKKQEAERKFQEAEQQRSDTLMAEMMAKLDQIFERQNTRLQNQQWSSQRARAPKFPQLDSAVLEEWCCRAEEYFAYHRTPDEHRVSLSTFHLEGTIREMQWFQDIRWSKRVTTWDEFVRILHTRYSVPEKVEEHDNFKNEDEEKEDDAATQTITPESVQDPIEDTKQIITPEPDPAEATQHKIIPTTNPAQDTNHIQIPEPVQAGNIGQTEIPATSPLIPKPKTSESIVEMSFSDRRVPIVLLSQSSTTDVVDVVLFKHRWRWKCVKEKKNAGMWRLKRTRRHAAVAGAAPNRESKVREIGLGADDLDGHHHQCFSLVQLAAWT
jgi:hypothetical protein